ncbi:MAG: hypothetical protein DMG29_07240 [Acidobacteria bacterium]|nr:MAG: hypothetical protein DMG29_07240 [Acidobacteriota bacterium]
MVKDWRNGHNFVMEKTKSISESSPVVLAVDDDPAVLRVIEALLTRNGYLVKTASSGGEALKILSQIVPAVLILDVMMPEVSGYDLCYLVKSEERLKKIPVIFLTARGAPQDFKTGQDVGGVIYMVKPFQPDRLLQVIQMVAPNPA